MKLSRVCLGVSALLALLLIATLTPSCGGADEDAPPSVGDTLVRERAAAHFAKQSYAAAREALAPLASRPKAQVVDLLAAAAVEMHDGRYPEARSFLSRVEERSPDDPALHYMSARMSLGEGEFERALTHLRKVQEALPEDLPTLLSLANTLYDLDQAEEAKAIYQRILDVGIENAGSWYVSAAYRMARIAVQEANDEESALYGDLWEQLRERGYEAVNTRQLDAGNLGVVSRPEPIGSEVPQPRVPTWVTEPPLLAELAGALELEAADVDGDRQTDLIARLADGLWIASWSEDFELLPKRVLEGALELARPIDLGNDDDLDFVVAQGAELYVLRAEKQEDDWTPEWRRDAAPCASLPSPPRDMACVDFDHDGDLDLFVVGAFGTRLLRNDGAATDEGVFTDATQDAGLPTSGDFTWCDFEDFDDDQDVDLLCGGPGGLYLADSLRAGRFRERTAEVFGDARFAAPPVLADFDGDARVDAFVPGASGGPASFWLQGEDGRFEARESALTVNSPPVAGARSVRTDDLDLDGAVDLFWAAEASRVEGALAAFLPVETPFSAGAGAATGPLISCDLDGDLDVDLLEATPEGIVVHRCEGDVGNAARLDFLGTKDNRRGVGAVVEIRTGARYRRIFWRGSTRLAGGGDAKWIDVLRIRWPNGVVQTWLDVEFGDQTFLDEISLEQEEGLVGSCPFLYTWNGETFEFISDVLGITPLGLPMAPGMLVPPDHDEYVLVRGDQLVPREGRLELAFTEELREVTYLDRVRLEAVDHPEGTKVYPNERFCFPPFPEHRIHLFREELRPTSATGSGGGDWTAALAEIDEVHAVPFEPYGPSAQGLAPFHWLELSFDPATLADAEQIRIAMTGWFFWTNASVNMKVARTPGIEFVPPILSVPVRDPNDPEAGERWEPIGPPVGFPAGKTKTMVLDLTDVLDREDPRLRVSSTLQLYWDAITLAIDGDDVTPRVTSLEPLSAHLAYRGFSAPIETGRVDMPVRFDWDTLAEQPRWNQHPGQYTRYGETVELLGAIDDRYVILGAGDALALTFDASSLPPVPAGHVRDWLVFFDGWAKDRDPNTLAAEEVEPLPFHGMSGYPYGADEAFPDDAEHRAWRAEWNTREATGTILPLSPKREAAWIGPRE